MIKYSTIQSEVYHTLAYKDERGFIMTRPELRDEYEHLKRNSETDAETFNEYVRNCCSKNGTLEVVYINEDI